MTTPATFAAARAAVLADNPQATEEQIIAAITAVPAPAYLEVPPRYQRVPPGFFRRVLLRTGEWAAITLASEPGQPQQVRGLAIVALGLLTTDEDVVDFLDPAVRTAFTTSLGALVTLGLVAQATATELLARCQPPQSWAQHIGWSPAPPPAPPEEPPP